uniref:E3 ubiquitin/ISG15 ligase TRIM25-like n=1 Tax=Leptobrachium leishanense TaxID=445787 RepID=A0A8C5PYW5_9ANUR
MASADLRDELTCPICTDIYTDPVTLTCGHNYCQDCITRTWDNQEEGEYSCPECRKRYRVRPELKRNLRLRNIAETFQETHKKREEVRIPCTYCIGYPVPAAKTCLMCEASLCEDHLKKHSKSEEHVLTGPTTSPENRKCSVHKEILRYYCCEDAACICVSCRLDGEHRGHQVETLNEASEKKKEKLRNILQKLTSQREEAEKRVQNLEEIRRQVQGKAAGVTERVTALIRDIRKQLEALEKRVLSEISRQEEQVSLRVSDLIRQLEIKKEELSRKMGDIEELCDMTDPVTVLQGRESDRDDYCDTEEDTERRDIKVHDAGDLDVGLISVTLHSGLAGIVTGITRRRRVPEASDMLLDVNTASDMLLDVNTASDMLLDVNTASHMLLDVNTASDMLLDVNTASNDVSVSEDLKTVSVSGINQRRPETPERFQGYDQVLTSRSFSSGRHYWKVEGSETGEWRVGMTYPSIERRGKQSVIGNNNKSWCLGKSWFNNHYMRHDSKSIQFPHSFSCCRFGIFLDYEAGRLSFYELCDPIRHLHTFTAAFTEPLHAGFGVYWGNSWVRI